MKRIIIIIIFLVLINLASAQKLEIVKESKTELIYGDNLNVKIKFNNPYNSNKIFEIKEILPQSITLVNPKNSEIEYYNGIKVDIYKWNINAKPNEIITIEYIIKPDNLGYYSIKPTMITDTSSEEVYKSQTIDFFVTCKSNNICDEGENSLNCILDCKQSGNDNICDYKADNICDPDCEEDPDCKVDNKINLDKKMIYIIGIIVIILIFVFVRKMKRNKI